MAQHHSRPMRVLHFLSNEAGDGPQQTVAVMIGVSGLTSSLLLALTNLGAEQAAANGGIQIALLVAYLIALAILFEARRFALVQSALAFETALLRFRVRLLDKLRRQEPRALEAQPGSESQAAVAEPISVLSHSVMSLGPMAEALVILVAIGLYIAWLSPASLVAILAVYAITTPIYWVRFLASRDRLSHAGALDRRFVTAAQACLHSVRSRPFDQRASDALFADLRRTSATALAPLRAGAERQMNDAIFATSSFYLALLAVGFLTPALVPELGRTMQQVVAALLFTIAPLAQLVNGAPVLARAEAALRALYAAEARLDAGLQRPVASPAPSAPLDLRPSS